MHPNFIPTKESNQWITVDKIKLHTGYNITYKITNKIIEQANNNVTTTSSGASIYTKSDNNEDVVTIFGLYNKNQPEESFIGFSNLTLPTFIELSIYRQINADDDTITTVFDNFIKPYDLTDFTFIIKEFVLGTQTDVQKRVDFYIKTANPIVPEFDKLPESIENDYITTEYLYIKRMDSFFEPSKESFNYFKPVTGWIYVICNMQIDKRYVICLPKEHSFHSLLSHITNKELLNDIKEIGIDNFGIIYQEMYIAKTPYDLMFRADFIKIKYYGIVGYNKQFAHEDSYQFMRKNLRSGLRVQYERKFFLMIQRQIFKKKFVDKVDYSNVCGIVYQIKNKTTGQRFIAQSYTTLYNVINEMYKTAIKGNVKYDKMVKALSEVPFNNFDIKVLVVKKNDDVKTGLGAIVVDLIMKYNTVETGYNLDSKTAARARRYGSRLLKKA